MTLPKLQIKYDRKISVATGASKKALKWVNSDFLWSEFIARLSIPLRTQETTSEYLTMSKAKRDVIKDVGGFVGGKLHGERRKIDNIESRSIITLDLDSIPTGVDIWQIVQLYDFAAALYSTHSNTPTSNRLRLIVPMARDVTPDEYGAISRMIAKDIGLDFCDDTTFEPHRLMYWPSCSIDAEYIFEYQDAPLLTPESILSRYDDWTDVRSWPVPQNIQLKNRKKKQADPTEKTGIVGAFCKTYDIVDVIDKYLPDIYLKTNDEYRYSYAPGSTVAGLIIYERGKFAYSHHSTDPACGHLVNAFDLVRIHKFGELDESVQDISNPTRLPSYKAMTDLALADKAVAYQLTLDRLDIFDDDVDEATEWLKSLELTSKGAIANTIDNIVIILQNDTRINQSYYYDAFRERPIVSNNLPWIDKSKRKSIIWNDSDDAGLRRFLEKEYKIESAAKIRDAVELAMLSKARHPVREYLSNLTWDGIERVETLFIDYLGADDIPYTRAVTKAALTGAVARIMEPGCKHDYMLVLVGPQGCGKSTILSKLGGEWFSDSLYTLSGKEAYEQIQGYWIIEMGEMAAAKKSEVEQIKHFISKKADTYRAAYARRTQEHLRQCVFFGSTNDHDFLKDPTGARRFWPVVVAKKTHVGVSALDSDTVNQVWAEAVHLYNHGEKWYLTGEIEEVARKIQRDHTEVSDKTGLVQAFVDREIPAEWDNMNLEERRLYWADSFLPADDKAKTVVRTKVCAIEIWCELFNGDPKAYTRLQARELNDILKTLPGWDQKRLIDFGPVYGRQRGFVRL